MMHSPRPFELFSASHIGILAALLLFGFGSVYLIKRHVPGERLRILELAYAGFVALGFLAERVAYNLFDHYPWHELLPLQFCGFSIILTVLLMLTRSRRIFEVLYFWGILGAFFGGLMPEVEYDFPHPYFISFFATHFFPLYAVIYFARIYGYRPARESLPRVFLLTNAYLLLMIPVNLALGTNYLFICAKPVGGGLFDLLGPWPHYIIPMQLIVCFMGLLVYLPLEMRARFLGRIFEAGASDSTA